VSVVLSMYAPGGGRWCVGVGTGIGGEVGGDEGGRGYCVCWWW